MSKRFYISKVVGDGSETEPFRPKIADYGVAWSGSVPSGTDENSPNFGKPLSDTCLVIVATANHAKLRNDADIDTLPDFPLDGKVSSINTATKNAMLVALKARGFDTSNIGSTDGFREVLQDLGRQRDPSFDIDNFDVAE